MKQKKVLSRLISAFVAVIMLIGIMPIISSADDGVILSYTFDTMEPTTVNFSNSAGQKLYKYDGKDFTFLCATEGKNVWAWGSETGIYGPGEFGYDTDRGSVHAAVPTDKEVYVSGGKLHINLNQGNHLKVYVPDVATAGQCKVSLNVSDMSGNGLLVRVDSYTRGNDGKALICSAGTNGLYANVVTFEEGDYLRIENSTTGTLSFAIDNLLIQKYVDTTATVTSSMPASGATNVSTYIKPSITFGNAVTDDVMNEIAVYAGSDKIDATMTKSADSQTVYIAPAEPLPGNTNIEIRIPNNSPVTFTTDDEGVLLHYTFDSKAVFGEYSYTNTSNKYELYSYDGKDHTFLRYVTGQQTFYTAWINGTTDSMPTTDNIDVVDGKLKVNVKAWSNFGIRIPDPGAKGQYTVEFKVANLTGALTAKIDNQGGRENNKPEISGTSSADGTISYKRENIEFLPSGDFLQISAGENGASFLLDDLVIRKYAESPVSIAGTFPEQNRENVPTYVDPKVTFDNVVTSDYANGIKILNGTDEIATTNTLSADGKTVTLKTASQLPANSLITVKADDNNSFTFKTGDRNVALFEDFETGTNDVANLGTIYGFGQYPWHSAKELAHCEQLGSRAIKFTFTDWGSASINLSPKTFGDNVNRRFKVSFDYYTDGSSVEAKLDGTQYSGGTKFIPTLTSGKKQHVEAVTGTQTLWAGAISFQNSTADTSEVTLYIDNIRVEDITENAWADIVWHEGNSLIMASSSTEKTNHMWTGMNGKTLTAKYNNLTDGTYKGYIAVYSGDTLVGAAAADITVADGAANDTVVITLPTEGDTGAFSVKAFLWNSEMTPIIEPTVLYNIK